MNIPFRVKTLTKTAKVPTQENEGDLWDIYADDFCLKHLKDITNEDFNNFDPNSNFNDSFITKDYNILHTDYNTEYYRNLIQGVDDGMELHPQGRILVKTGISLELPTKYNFDDSDSYMFENDHICKEEMRPTVKAYAVADIRPRSGLALKHGITVLNTPGTIDNSYRKEIGIIIYNAGHKPYTINRGDKIAQMLIRPLYPSTMEIVDNINDTERGGYGSTGK